MKKILKRKLGLALLAFFLAMTIPVYFFINGFNEAADIYASTEANALLTYEINKAIYSYYSGGRYDEYVSITKSSDGRTMSLSIDSAKINMLSSELVLVILDSIGSIEKGDFRIPAGNAFGSRFFSGRGPGIDVRVVPIGTVATDIDSSFTSAGINQTLHRIKVDFIVCVNLLTPFSDSSSTISLSVNIAETIIVGEVPQLIWDSSQPS